MLASTCLTVLQGASQPLEFVCTRLQGWGCHITRCATSLEVLQTLVDRRTDLILIDVAAPDSMRLVARLKADPETRHLPTIAVTADDPAAVAAYALALGADDIFALPIEDLELFTRVRALARLAMLEIELRRRESVLATFGVRVGHDPRAVPAIVVAARRPLAGLAPPLLPRDAPPRILFRGGPLILEGAARDLVRRRALLVGTDAISIDPVGDDALPAHRILLAAGIVLLEGLDLSRAPAGLYDLLALPLLIPGADGAPARALLRPRGPRPQRRK